MQLANNLGAACGFVLGPACVPPGHPGPISTLLYVHLALLSVSISLVAAHFSQDPGVVTADGEGGKGSVIEGVHQAFRHQSFMLLAVSGGLANGVFNGWSGVMSEILLPQGFSSTDAWWISFAATVGACGGGLLLGSLLDSHLLRMFKTVLLVLLCCCGVCFTWFTLGLPSALYDVPPLTSGYWTTLVAVTLAGSMPGMTVPVYYELAVELTYPLPGSVSCGLLTLFMNAGTMVFLCVPPAANA